MVNTSGAASVVSSAIKLVSTNTAGQANSSNSQTSGSGSDSTSNKIGKLTDTLNFIAPKGQAAKVAQTGQQVASALSPYASGAFTSPAAAMFPPAGAQAAQAAAAAAGALGGSFGGGGASGSSGAPRRNSNGGGLNGGSPGGGCGPGGCPPPDISSGSNGGGSTTTPINPGNGTNSSRSKVYGTPTNIDFNRGLTVSGNESSDQTKATSQALKEGVVIKNFTATWCGPCKQMAPTVGRLQKDTPIVKVDADQNAELANQHGVAGYPSFVAGYKDPNTNKFVETGRLTGVVSEDALKNLYQGATQARTVAIEDKKIADAKVKETLEKNVNPKEVVKEPQSEPNNPITPNNLSKKAPTGVSQGPPEESD